jgi:hypothetical protein
MKSSGLNEVVEEQNRAMNRQEVLDSVRGLATEQELQWMFDLGAQLTISARGAYAVHESGGDVLHLMGFNELQHQVYGRSRQLRRGEEWTLESFLDGLIEKATVYKIEGDLGWAIQVSLRNIRR